MQNIMFNIVLLLYCVRMQPELCMVITIDTYQCTPSPMQVTKSYGRNFLCPAIANVLFSIGVLVVCAYVFDCFDRENSQC
jgi:hypothetical protein